MASKENAVKKYIVTLSDEEREQLTALIQSGKHPAQKLLKARILLKADVSEGGEGLASRSCPCSRPLWSDCGRSQRSGLPDLLGSSRPSLDP